MKHEFKKWVVIYLETKLNAWKRPDNPDFKKIAVKLGIDEKTEKLRK